MSTTTVNNESDIDPEQWLSAMPAPPTAVCARLEAAGVRAKWYPESWPRETARGGDIFIQSTFSKLPAIKQILIESDVKRSKWPRPPRWRRRKGACQIRLLINCPAAGPAVPSTVCLKLTIEQRLKLEQYAQRLSQTPKMAAQALFDNALNAVAATRDNPVTIGNTNEISG